MSGSDADPHHDHDDQQQQDPPARPDTAVTVFVGENRADPSATAPLPPSPTLPFWQPHTHTNPLHAQYCYMCLYGRRPGQEGGRGGAAEVVAAEEGEGVAENSPTYEDLCAKGYLVPSGSGVGGGKSMDETVLRRGEGSGDDQTGTPEGVVKTFRQKADFEKGNVPAKILEESIDAVYAATIGHDVAEALKDDITWESVVEPELVERAWDVVEEMNELTAEEQQLVKQHSEEFDQLVLCGEPTDLMEIDKKERKDGIDPSDVALPPITLSVDYEPPVDGLDEVIAGQGDGVSSMDIPIKFEEEPLAGCVV
ncbi:hypothetical protein FOZ63_029510, partial [Perkinsus olseni]